MSSEQDIILTILMPCLDEARTLPSCISKARAYLARQTFQSEIIVADNGSNDDSCEIARSLGARVITVPRRGYGNALLTAIGRLLFRSPVNDFYCGLRGFRRHSILQLDLTSPGMEFALEMIVKATINDLRITEVPTTLSPDRRGKPSHLRSWRDG